MRTLYYDERTKMTVPRACSYCGSEGNPSIDHLIPRIMGGADESDNLILACRACNSSKRGRDMLEWMTNKDTFPSIWLLRRYLKLVAPYCEENDLLNVPLSDALERDLPFDLTLLPHVFPPVTELRLWVYPSDAEPA